MRHLLTVLPTVLALGLATHAAAADPGPGAPASDPASDPVPVPITATLAPMLWLDAPAARAVPSLRIEAARVAAERFQDNWRYPEPGSLLLVEGGDWLIGAGLYQPRSRRAAALHGGSIAATFVGEILLASGSPLGGVGAMLVGATLDDAAATADRDAEASR